MNEQEQVVYSLALGVIGTLRDSLNAISQSVSLAEEALREARVAQKAMLDAIDDAGQRAALAEGKAWHGARKGAR